MRVDEWVQALADCTGLPVDVVAVPEGGALGSAFIARCVAGLEGDDERRRAAGPASPARVEPDPRWVAVARRATSASATSPPTSGQGTQRLRWLGELERAVALDGVAGAVDDDDLGVGTAALDLGDVVVVDDR